MQYFKLVVNQEQLDVIKYALNFYYAWMSGDLGVPHKMMSEVNKENSKIAVASLSFLKEVKSLLFPDLTKNQINKLGSHHTNGSLQNKIIAQERDTAWELFRDIHNFIDDGNYKLHNANFSDNLPIEIEKFNKIFYTE